MEKATGRKLDLFSYFWLENYFVKITPVKKAIKLVSGELYIKC